jgi:aspartyl-tRNA(Asn)/glutamyl-tRNA(Gln) amidotransferase subunit A
VLVEMDHAARMSITDLTLSALARDLSGKKVSSTEATNACLDRIARLDGQLGAFLFVDDKGAKAAAAESDARRARGESRGPLDGVPIALKDNFLQEGVPCTAASKILEGYVAPYDGTTVAKLKAHGAVLLGKLNCDEFAMGSSTENSAYKVTKNPWDLARTPGGSSGGSAAAVAAGMCFGSTGTDTGGSIRQPAGFCGVVGIKPTYGRVSRFGIVAFASSLDQVGPFARDVEGAAHLLEALAGHDPRDSTSVDKPVPAYGKSLGQGVKGLRVGLPKEYFAAEGLSPDVAQAIEGAKKALTAAGATLVDVTLPHTKYAVATYYIVATAEASSNLARYDGVRYGPRVDEGKGLLPMYEQTRGRLFGDEVKRRIMLGTYVLSHGYYDAYYVRAQKVRRRLAEDFENAWKSCDLILCPTSPTAPFKIGERTSDPLTMYLSDIFTISANLAGLPGLALNAGFTADGLPLGLQLLGKAFDEETLFRAAATLEGSLGLKDRRPKELA